ncbi:hypothetical protein QBC41DRAFT_301552 [Cercophora samala]|uniref:Uncharacterized protein n=1 Tax=Cercophora samala TaxID=330535 RepID=A0AA39ZGH6_9PEZI|nr:hypothetical protein QBC41DRAFT_301552 [Cercophora samala]
MCENRIVYYACGHIDVDMVYCSDAKVVARDSGRRVCCQNVSFRNSKWHKDKCLERDCKWKPEGEDRGAKDLRKCR